MTQSAPPLQPLLPPAARAGFVPLTGSARAVLAGLAAGPAAYWLLFALAVWLRAVDLAAIPGLNGDEAWYGVQAQRWWAGEPVAWRTPTGNPINPFFFLPTLLLAGWFPPSVALLRLPALISGLAALVANAWYCRRCFDGPTALATTLALAVLPTNLAYSRFGWDASQSLLATVLVTYASVDWARQPLQWRRAAWSITCLLAACWVHPTNIFLAPWMLVGPLAGWVETSGSRVRAAVAGTALAVAAGLVLGWLAPERLAAGLGRLVNPAAAGEFVVLWLRLLSGVSTYQYIPGALLPVAAGGDTPGWALAVIDLVALAVVLLGLAGLLRPPATSLDRALAAGYVASLGGFYLVAGPAALAPHFERYGLALIAPAVLLVARGWLAWCTRPTTSAATAGQAHLVALGAACLSLAGFWNHYLLGFRATGGRSHEAFAVGAVEPKLAAVQLIARQAQGRPVTIAADSWWSYWPVAYLAGERSNWRVVPAGQLPSPRRASAEQGPTELWLVQFQAGGGSQQCVLDVAGRPILTVRRVVPPPMAAESPQPGDSSKSAQEN